ncbi:cerebellar degeneration-related protein 2 [Callorhinchus milii]|uniref:Cerebellar degeneration-related protein 2 n=1 Tax=Callorhinchus milii TaxID=7868 RepID=V9KCE8_CALMI|nr:cerebellar degeneration-related protein 2 [Callorhinchus milii]
MLTDTIVEDFELREEDAWYPQQDLERDLHLAAELGKTLLNRNTELEEALQQMYATNQEQIQEIDYLTKQVELLREMNEQHAKVYEQLDSTARDLEVSNQKLVVESKVSHQKILGLTETIESLQSHVEDIQKQMEGLKKPELDPLERDAQQRALNSLPCLKELYDLRKYFVYDHVFAEKITSTEVSVSPMEEENEQLKKTLNTLQTQLTVERQRRATIEQEYSLVLRENSELEKDVSHLDNYKQCIQELETEVVELRQKSQLDNVFVSLVDNLLPESFLFAGKESSDIIHVPATKAHLNGPSSKLEADGTVLKRSSSETMLKIVSDEDLIQGHEQTCIRRAEAVRKRGISLLNEVDEQYNALQLKYEELLKKCQIPEGSLTNKAVQTKHPSPHQSENAAQYERTPSSGEPGAGIAELAATTTQGAVVKTTGPLGIAQPEYKVLFKEIFSCIKKTKDEIDQHRMKYKSTAQSQKM